MIVMFQTVNIYIYIYRERERERERESERQREYEGRTKKKVPFFQSVKVCQGQWLFDRHLKACSPHNLRNVRISFEYQKQQQEKPYMTVKTTPK